MCDLFGSPDHAGGVTALWGGGGVHSHTFCPINRNVSGQTGVCRFTTLRDPLQLFPPDPLTDCTCWFFVFPSPFFCRLSDLLLYYMAGICTKSPSITPALIITSLHRYAFFLVLFFFFNPSILKFYQGSVCGIAIQTTCLTLTASVHFHKVHFRRHERCPAQQGCGSKVA